MPTPSGQSKSVIAGVLVALQVHCHSYLSVCVPPFQYRTPDAVPAFVWSFPCVLLKKNARPSAKRPYPYPYPKSLDIIQTLPSQTPKEHRLCFAFVSNSLTPKPRAKVEKNNTHPP